MLPSVADIAAPFLRWAEPQAVAKWSVLDYLHIAISERRLPPPVFPKAVRVTGHLVPDLLYPLKRAARLSGQLEEAD